MRLPKPRKRGNSYQIEIMLDGKRYSATRDTAAECTKWASQKMLEHKAGLLQADNSAKPHTLPFADLLTLYHDKVGKFKPSARTEILYIKAFTRDFPTLADTPISDITAKDLTNWRNKRLESVSAGTVRREIAYFSSVMGYAVRELFAIAENPFNSLTKPSMPKARNRRISDDDIQAVLTAGNYQQGQSPAQTQQYVAWAFLFAIHTAMRRGEILGIDKADIKDGYIHLPKTKNGEARNVPLTPKARDMISWISHDHDKLIPFDENAFKKSWQRVQKKANLDDLNFHDTRHEAISRFVKDLGLPVETLAKVTGHKDIKTLVNTYYNPTIDELVDLFQK